MLPVGYRGEKPLASISQYSSLSHVVTTPIDPWKLPLSSFSCTHLPGKKQNFSTSTQKRLLETYWTHGWRSPTATLPENLVCSSNIMNTSSLAHWDCLSNLFLTLNCLTTESQSCCFHWVGQKWNTRPSNLKVLWKEKPEHNIHILPVNSPTSG